MKKMIKEENITRALSQTIMEGAGQRGRRMAYSLVTGRPEKSHVKEAIKPGATSLCYADRYEGMEPTDWMTLGGLELEHVVVDCTMSKQIVTTAINGHPGTVKEWVADGDVVINLKIIEFGDGGYPKYRVKEILDELKKAETLKVVHEVLNDMWNVQRVVVTSVKPSGRTERDFEEIEVGMLSDDSYVVEEQG